MRSSADIQHEIERLKKEYDDVKLTEKGQWPRAAILYPQFRKESLLAVNYALGLSQESCRVFMQFCHEIAISVSVEQDGTTRIMSVNEHVL